MHKLEPDQGREYLYQLDGNSVLIRQMDVGSIIFLRIEEKEGVDAEKVANEIRSHLGSSLSKQVIILPSNVNVLKVSPMIRDYGNDKFRDCNRCGGKMRYLNTGGWLCFNCNNEIPPPLTSGNSIGIGDY